MKSISAILIACLPLLVFSQPEKAAYKAVADSFEQRYNRGDYAAIFASFGPEMQKALPLEQTEEFLAGLMQQAGRIEQRNFSWYEQSYACYKTRFERALFSLNISLGRDHFINGLFIRPFKERNQPVLKRNTTKMALPFTEEWTVIWGGDTKEQNYHVESEAQKGAFDMVITDASGKSYKTDGATNEDYYAFGQELLSPCDAEVVLAVDGVKDNQPGTLNPIYVPGNTVILKTTLNEYLLFAHFKQQSIVVKQGQIVKRGQLLGLCGNSGNSSEPHLHFHIQNVEDMNIATGAKCFFEKLLVNDAEKADYSPVKGDRIKNAGNGN